MDVAFKCYEWPAKMARAMKDATAKASAEHKQFEAQLKTRRAEFGESLGGLQTRVAAFAHYDVPARRAEHAREVRFVRCAALSKMCCSLQLLLEWQHRLPGALQRCLDTASQQHASCPV